LDNNLYQLPVEDRENVERVLQNIPELLNYAGEIAAVGDRLGELIRHHGDYHLGQVLLTEKNDFILLDFEGEPLRPLAERRMKGSAIKDLAGMIRSFHYASETALTAAVAETEDNGSRGQLVPWCRAWYEWVSSTFVDAYFETAGGAPFLPDTDMATVLDFYLLEKVFYELKYEMNSRPDWIRIPLAGIVEILDRKANRKRENH
ncbi:MAG: maltose alpha-D-glucosyltransferase, partial [Desulforhopalus sp.]